jgi:hypothetical protein
MKKAKADRIRPLPIAPGSDQAKLATALEAARKLGEAVKAVLLTDESMLTTAAIAELLGISETGVRRKRKRHEILGLELVERRVRYPDWQLLPNRQVLPGLPRLFEILGDDPWRVFRFLTAVHAELGGKTGADALRDGDVERVLAAAENTASGGFS